MTAQPVFRWPACCRFSFRRRAASWTIPKPTPMRQPASSPMSDWSIFIRAGANVSVGRVPGKPHEILGFSWDLGFGALDFSGAWRLELDDSTSIVRGVYPALSLAPNPLSPPGERGPGAEAGPVCSQVSSPWLFRCRCLRVLVHLEAIVAVHAHLGNVEPLDFRIERRPVAHEFLGDEINDERQDGECDEAGGHADQLRPELAQTAAVEQTFDGAGHAIPAVAVGAVGEQSERQATPRAVDTVNRDGPDAIINADPVEEENRFDDQDTGDRAKNGGAAGAHKR